MKNAKWRGALATAGILLTWTLGPTSSNAQVLDFNDITLWAGSGSNQAAVVIDWRDGLDYPGESFGEALVWGYRWDGAATGLDMIQAIAVLDIRLSVFTTTFSFGEAVTGISYDLTGDGSIGPNDHDRNGFEPDADGFWAYWADASELDEDGNVVNPPAPGYPASWGFTNVGAGDRLLQDGSWDGWSWAIDFISEPPSQGFAAIPEPNLLTLLVAGLGLALIRRRRFSTS